MELRDGRENPEWREEARRLVALRTLPVLTNGTHALGDSSAIVRWLDSAYPQAPRLWPDGEDAFGALEVAALVDATLNSAVDVGTRYFALRDHLAWDQVTGEMRSRGQRSLDALADRVSTLGLTTIAASGWTAADMWLFTAVAWLEGLPARAGANPNAAQIVRSACKYLERGRRGLTDSATGPTCARSDDSQSMAARGQSVQAAKLPATCHRPAPGTAGRQNRALAS